MKYQVESQFPDQIDTLEFISDVDIAHRNIISEHQTFIAKGKYSNASEYLANQNDITPVTAELFNLISNRIIALQTYLSSIDKCNRAVYGNEPVKPADKAIWIE